MVIDGSVKLENAIIVYGQIKGGVITKGSVRLAKSAAVYGDIIGDDIRIAGLVEGNILSVGHGLQTKYCLQRVLLCEYHLQLYHHKLLHS